MLGLTVGHFFIASLLSKYILILSFFEVHGSCIHASIKLVLCSRFYLVSQAASTVTRHCKQKVPITKYSNFAIINFTVIAKLLSITLIQSSSCNLSVASYSHP